jgi:hypothetical protein
MSNVIKRKTNISAKVLKHFPVWGVFGDVSLCSNDRSDYFAY